MSNDSTFDTAAQATDPGQKSPEELEREVDAQRSSIGQIVDALEKKMSPGQWIDQALAYTRQNGGEFVGNLGQSVRQNPLPTLLMSVGVAWLVVGQRNTSPRAGGSSGSLLEPLADSVDNVKGKVQATASRLKEKARQLTPDKGSAEGTLKIKGQRLQTGVSDLAHQQPLVLAGIAVALGAALGRSLPPVERKWTRHDPLQTTSAGLG
ncbi:DUF3618 domain-containing protein [Pseudomonas ovata]|uniref:DUF3618 domain-containing protein n=1 Tax=Pseudomonas ovata TaxID=1839709 RepID=UPI000D69ACE6|nr:DUF3618 domain-containing protein [Pseudomonas ovata]